MPEMNPLRRNIAVPAIIALIFVIAWFLLTDRRKIHHEKYKIELSGVTMGTIYNIRYLDLQQRDLQPQIDSLLDLFNQSLSTYIPDSEISTFNKKDTLVYYTPYFLPVLKKSSEVYEKTKGAFDPTVMPLVNAWGFGPEDKRKPDSLLIDSLMQFVGFDKIAFDAEKAYKKKEGVQLDFSAIAKGYGVDVAADYLVSQGISNLIVDIGGEVICRGKNEKGALWKIGINNPLPETGRWLYAVLELNNRAVATSGNYQNYYEEGGKIISHTISPFTGYPVRHELLSASVVANDCITADAYATGFMVLGVDESKKILLENPELEGYLIFKNEQDSLDSFFTPGIQKMIEETSPEGVNGFYKAK